jgi:hypothetical protein
MGVNTGYFPPEWTDQKQIALAREYGCRTLRTGLFHNVLEQWGYDEKREALLFARQQGIVNVVGILGYPSLQAQDTANQCQGNTATTFKGLYLPVWKGPSAINEQNTYALYVWKVANTFKGLIRIYEVWNEPDAGWGGLEKGQSGNWWDAPPPPCQTGLKASIFSYIRMLRITYEVIKKVDPDALIAVGGLGWPAYLDAICRYTDQPESGIADHKLYPLTGGAYFDCMSFHAYPHQFAMGSIDTFPTRYYSNIAINGFWQRKYQLEQVLLHHGYDNVKYPKKNWICSEFNLPRISSKGPWANPETQTDFAIKAFASAPGHGVSQMHLYALSDGGHFPETDSEFAFMGMFASLDTTVFSQPKPHPIAKAMKQLYQLTQGFYFSSIHTADLKLPSYLSGGAFEDKNGQITLILWQNDVSHLPKEGTVYNLPEKWRTRHWTCYPIGSAFATEPRGIHQQTIPIPEYPILLKTDEYWH